MSGTCDRCKNNDALPHGYCSKCVEEILRIVAERKDGAMRTFDTGATRDTDENKLDYEAFLSPRVLRRYAEYLNSNRIQSDGKPREGDNWQQGIPKDVYMKSLVRHVMDVWCIHRQEPCDSDLETALCAVIFNAMGYLFEETRND